MKELGRTETGNFIIEMSTMEHHWMHKLQVAASGKNWNFMTDGGRFEESDLGDALRSVCMWTTATFEITRLQDLVNNLGAAIRSEECE